ncbi:DUF1501 domain-containing protein [Solemya velum gill symbiont]|uniref:DUF1501 domain-containing protein n=1 Tax=Solemya velum gill symbiont TaxID=2340 RepID=UPI0009967526|nr:DUF1501 domain-containing protein [Solemya velum gill symbiont]OOY66253.1 hypothetical protein BOW05_02765 [Solemya velum gill symbiont]
MKRRDFVKLLGAAGAAGALPGVSLRSASAAEVEPFEGMVLVTLVANGGWDHSSLCDPRENPAINHWADTMPAGTAGNLRYAPFAENAEFFDKYFDRMLVINGIDLQTNGHSAARLTQASGALSGYPVLNAIYGAIHNAGLPMPWLIDGSSTPSQDLGLQPVTRLPATDLMRSLANPNRRDGTRQFLRTADIAIIEQYRQERLQALLQENGMPYRDSQVASQLDARINRGLMHRLDDVFPETIDSLDLKGESNSMISRIHRMLVAIQAGICVTASASSGGFDTHGNHDAGHTTALTRFTRSVDYLWEKAEELGIADRIVLHLTSDVGRTPHYNSNNGKDHWSVGSSIVMMKNQPWTNRSVGMTDAPLCQEFSIDVPDIDLLNPAYSNPVIV